ncbi:hypothetical protein [Haloquadratum walsbyi]|nr:hypothetical protein [Haloquadratum walsbyi]
MTRTRFETSIQRRVGIAPAVEAPAFRLGEDITPEDNGSPITVM